MLEIDFQTIYRINLEEFLPTRTWRAFEVFVAGLAANRDSLLHHLLKREREEEDEPWPKTKDQQQ